MIFFATLNRINHGKGNLSEWHDCRSTFEDDPGVPARRIATVPSRTSETDTKYLTRRETAHRLRISLVTLTDWVNHGKIRAHKIGGRVLFRDSDVEAALNRIVPIK